MRTELVAAAPTKPPRVEDQVFPRVAGALVGAAAADALGWITEFVRGPDHLRKLYGTDRVTAYRGWQKTSGGRFNAYIDRIHKGEYSDDTQLTLAIARSIRADGTIDIEHFSKRELPLWLDYARGAGSTITAAARAISRRSARWNRNFFQYKHRSAEVSYRDAGANGAAMRVGPIALANPSDPERMAMGVWQTSIVTHGHPRAILGALVHAEALRILLAESDNASAGELLAHLNAFVAASEIPDDEGIAEWVHLWNEDTSTAFQEVWAVTRQEVEVALSAVADTTAPLEISTQLRRLGCFDPATKGSGTSTVLGGLLLFGLLGNDFRDAVTTTINQLGTDTDTIGGFVGGLCGARLGYESIPEDWASELQDYEYFMRVASELSRVAARSGEGGKALLPDGKGEAANYPALLELLRDQNIDPHQRVYHPLFGLGWVESVDAHRLRRKDGAEVVLARVQFDIGQSCRFRFMKVPGRRKPVVKRPPRNLGQQTLGE